MLIKNNIAAYMTTLAIVFLLSWTGGASAGYPYVTTLPNGIEARIYPADHILETMVTYDLDGRMVMDLPGGEQYILVEDIDDPVIVNKGDGSFHPFSEQDVIAALSGIDAGTRIDLAIELYILPLPRRFIQTSSTDGLSIFLSPGVYEYSYEVAAYTVTHEIGHCVRNRFMPDGESALWDEYLSIRGLDDSAMFCSTGEHMYRPEEIFAEDFRFLFGCPASCYSGTIENPYIELPCEVAGLEGFIVSMVSTVVADAGDTPSGGRVISAMNYPNPFNPSTTIRMDVGSTGGSVPVEVNVYSADGRLVRKLYSGTAGPGIFDLSWDGRNDGGRMVGSGTYFYSIISTGGKVTGKMLLLR